MATLIYSDVDGVDRSFALGNEPVMVGRAPECAIRSQDPRVSRLHARFFVEAGTLWVEDLGSSNGIFVGPNKVQRAPVPTGEIILVGSLMIRLLPASGTLPPPMGLHGTLASWLDLERKTRSAVEEERDAFAKRVGELHQQIAAIKVSPTLSPDSGPAFDAEAIRLRDEAEARAAALEKALAAVQDEVLALRQQGAGGRPPTSNELDANTALEVQADAGELRARIRTLEAELAERADWSSNLDVESTKLANELARLQTALDQAQDAQSISEHALSETRREAQELRAQLDQLRRASAAELEIARLDAAKAREAKLMAETAVGIAAAEKLAEADLVISGLQTRIKDLEAAQVGPDAKSQQLAEQITTLTARAEKLEKDLSAAQIRAQGAERNLSGANASAAKAETRAAQLEQAVQEAEARATSAADEVAKALERAAALETRVGAGDAPLQAAEARSAKLADELAEMTSQFETRRDRLVELENSLAAAGDAAKAATARADAAKTELGEVTAKLAAADKRARELEVRLSQLATADSTIAAATQQRDDAVARADAAAKRVVEAERRAADLETRASAADTMAKAMAKDVAEALRRAAEADKVAKSMHREIADSQRRATEAEAKLAQESTAISDAERRATEAEARATALQGELTAQIEATQKQLTDKLAATQKELADKLAATQRELAAERSGFMALVDRKTHLEREVADARAQLPALKLRAEEAEQKLVEAEVQIDTLQERLTDAESGIAVSETAAQASLEEAREELRVIRASLAETTQRVAQSQAATDELVARVAELERQLRATQVARDTAEAALRDAREQIDALAAKAEAAELAIGRAGALQRQLDEALSKLTGLEREASTTKGREAKAAEQAEAMIVARVASAETRAKEAELRARTAEERAADAERRAASGQGSDTRVADLERKLVLLQKEVDAAENVRSFAAETEREIAQFQRDLRDALSKLAQVTLERDRLERALAEARGGHDLEVTAQADLQAMISQATDLQEKVKRLERQDATLRQQLADAEQRLRETIDAEPADGEATRTGAQQPIALAEHVSVLEESIDSLRSNMRAASDETAMMDQSESVMAVSSAVSAAAEHIERARAAIKALAAAIGMTN